MNRPNPLPRSLVISDRRGLGIPLLDWLPSLLPTAGTFALQIREKDLADRELYELTVQARRILGPAVALLVNGRVDIALAAGAQGVHLPAQGLPVSALRRRFGRDLLVGCSTHSVGEGERAARDGADYVTFGPILPTPNKAGLVVPKGFDALAEAVAALRPLPVFALGGLFPEHLPAVAAAGAWGVAGIRLFQGGDPAATLATAAAALTPPERS
jgi:thiamine-phosphate pyrophosphorylase